MSTPHPLPPGTRCERCGLTAADWKADAAGVRWTVRDIRPDERGRPVCERCRQTTAKQPHPYRP